MKRNLIKVWRPSDLTQLELQRGFSVNRPVPRHWHEEYQFCLVEAGSGDLTYRGKDFLTPAASLFVVHPGEVHSNRAFDGNGCSFRTIFLRPEVMEVAAAELQGNYEGLPFFPSVMVLDRDIIRDFSALHRSFEQVSTSLERETRLQNFLVSLITGFAENRLSAPPRGKEQNAVRRACDYLTANCAENISLEKLAGIANLSPFHLNRAFSRQYGMPPHEFQVQLRLSQAKRLMREGMGISHAAYETGFADQSHLTRHLKRVMGFTPGQYK